MNLKNKGSQWWHGMDSLNRCLLQECLYLVPYSWKIPWLMHDNTGIDFFYSCLAWLAQISVCHVRQRCDEAWSAFSMNLFAVKMWTYICNLKEQNNNLISITPVFRTISFFKYVILMQLSYQISISDQLSAGFNISRDVGKSWFLTSTKLQ